MTAPSDHPSPLSGLAPALKSNSQQSKFGSHRAANILSSCEVMSYYKDYRHFRSKATSRPLGFGSLIHSGISYYWAERMTRKPKWYQEQPDVTVKMVEDALGNPLWLRQAADIMAAYEKYRAGSPWVPMFNEETFSAAIGDLDPNGEDEPAEDFEYVCRATGETKIHQFPNLNSERVTCRPDLVIKAGEGYYCIDHKGAGGDTKQGGSLKVINPMFNDLAEHQWQAMWNSLVIRNGRCDEVEGSDRLPLRGFQIARFKRDLPLDFKDDQLDLPAMLYAEMPRIIRETVRRNRAILKKVLRDPKQLLRNPQACYGGKYKCDFINVCSADSAEERNLQLSNGFKVEG